MGHHVASCPPPAQQIQQELAYPWPKEGQWQSKSVEGTLKTFLFVHMCSPELREDLTP